MKKIVISVLTSLLLFQSTANAEIIQGYSQSCKIGKTKKDLNYKYKCIQPGIWKKTVKPVKKIKIPVSVITPVPTPSPTPSGISYAPPSQLGSNIDTCKIRENNSNRAGMQNPLAAGFPSVSPLPVKFGTVKWALIPIDFADIPGDKNFRSRIDGQMSMLSEWYSTVSEGKFNVEWVVADDWVTLPGKSTDYEVMFSDNLDRTTNGLKIWQNAISKSDLSFDYTGVQVINFILPLEQTVIKETVQGFPWDSAIRNYSTSEGKISSFTMPGVFFNQNGREYWEYWAHEFGHAIAIPHVGGSRIRIPFHDLDIMGDQSGSTRELSGWLRFVAGWLDDEKVYCQDLSKLFSTEVTLVPLSGTDDGIKMVVIPVDQSKTLVIESRRVTKFSRQVGWVGDGVLAYIYDSTLSHGEEFLTPLVKSGSSLLYEGNKITFEGITIEVLLSKNLDKIKISR